LFEGVGAFPELSEEALEFKFKEFPEVKGIQANISQFKRQFGLF